MIVENLKILGMTFFGLLTKKNTFSREHIFDEHVPVGIARISKPRAPGSLILFCLFLITGDSSYKWDIWCELYELIISHTQAGGYSSVLCF
jgi:hypothetical protein